MRVHAVPCLSDNYAYLLVCERTNSIAIIDASEAEPVLRAVEANAPRSGARKVEAIFSTHHHPDHVGGNIEVKEKLGVAAVYGHASDKGRVPAQTHFLKDGDVFTFGALSVRALHIPGHTTGAVAYVVTEEPHDPVVFTGDTLFVAGCGKLFEGTPAMMHASLEKLAALEAKTAVYCGHEYTESNLRFAKHVEPSNAAIDKARERAAEKRKEGRPTVPSTIEAELATNPFMRVRSAEIRKTLGIKDDASDADALGAIREAKNTFR